VSTPQQYQQPQYPPQMQQQPYPSQQYPQQAPYQQAMPPQQQYAPPAAPQTTYQTPSADDFLMGGGGAPSAKFLSRGDTTAGRITETPKVEQQRDIKTGEKKFWNDGNPMMQLVVTVATIMRDPNIKDDDGRLRIFIKGAMKTAVQDAVGRVGARGLEVGGYLSVTYTHELEAKGPGMSPPKQYRAEYTSAANAELMGGQQPAPAPVPQQYQQPAPQPQYAPPAQVPPAAQQYAAPVAQQAAPAAPVDDAATRALVQQIQGQQQPAQAAAPGVEPPF
jgi:hypothetical protein